ncbi:hypothetical protein KUTeg_009891 [Tegillarca granosa]|uniref:PiggyBac transposable element-derived protein domain-containing protein n=1 Tax=Tegillarca granosa TaxID=220873 RepID=A0ABQ9F560_TEGGR|nr:hypothetical protein KUTeg_009891 [Tegillarca granosa]
MTEQVVLSLLNGYENQGHVVYTDNFYTSPNLCVMLQNKNIGSCGTVKSNRKYMPQQLNPNNLKLKKNDDPVFMRTDDLVACTWQDTKRVMLLSTVHNNLTMAKEVRSKNSETGKCIIEKPVMANDYNKFMADVDLLDQQLGTYCYPHKS